MGVAATSYFESLFVADPNVDVSHIIDLIYPIISAEENDTLCADFSIRKSRMLCFRLDL